MDDEETVDIIGEINDRAQEIVGAQGVPFADILCLIGTINKRLGKDRIRFNKRTDKLIREYMRMNMRKGVESYTGDWVRAWMDRRWGNECVAYCQEFIFRLCESMDDDAESMENRAVERRAMVPVMLKGVTYE